MLNIFLVHFLSIKGTNLFNATGLGILPAAPLLPTSPLISFYQVVDASFQSPIVVPCIHTHLLAYNVISAYLIVW